MRREKTIIQDLRFGIRALSRTNWVSRLSVAGLLGVAGFVLAVKDGRFGNLNHLDLFSEKEDPRDSSLFVPGLQNLGNNCFLNVVLQALASCKDFRLFLQGSVEECEYLVGEEHEDFLPLTFALTDLLEELCVLKRRKAVSTPRKVMLAMSRYVRNFNLTSQQDSAEAFLHLLSSLREELSDCYIPSPRTLGDLVASPNLKILAPRGREDLKEHKRWQKLFLGPFDGILGSMLTCRSCPSQISMDFQFFHTLLLAPVLDRCSSIMFGCTLEDCLKKFLGAEKVDNYFCSRCWHSAAIQYLLVRGADQMEIERLSACHYQDKCDCQSIRGLETLPWSNNMSHTQKQLYVARCPKVLCIHVQRVSVNMFGEPFKVQGHVDFPLVLDLSPFLINEAVMNEEEKVHQRKVKLQYRKSSPYFDLLNMQFNRKVLNDVSRPVGKMAFPETVDARGSESTESCFDEEDSPALRSAPKESHLYALVAVVEHFGRAGGGHYTVYRRVKLDPLKEVRKDDKHSQWFSISDSSVTQVSEADVVAAEASLLFYERLSSDSPNQTGDPEGL